MALARLILASASPRRQSLLREAGFEFIIHPADIDETLFPPHLNLPDLALYLATAKAEAVSGHYPGDVILGADTVVAHAEQWLSKPTDADDARRMLRLLSGTTHRVITGVCAIAPERKVRRAEAVISTVQMRPMSSWEIEAYIEGGEWRGKAGAYGIQDADPFVTRTTGSHTNIVGLPMETVVPLLGELGIHPMHTPGLSGPDSFCSKG